MIVLVIMREMSGQLVLIAVLLVARVCCVLQAVKDGEFERTREFAAAVIDITNKQNIADALLFIRMVYCLIIISFEQKHKQGHILRKLFVEKVAENWFVFLKLIWILKMNQKIKCF